MVIWVFRAVFLLAAAGIGFQIGGVWTRHAAAQAAPPERVFWGIIIAIVLAFAVMGLESIFSRRPARSIGAVLFGLIAGFILAYLLKSVALLAIGERTYQDFHFASERDFEQALNLTLIAVCSYIGVAMIFKTRDQFRFVIPYVEFSREQKSLRPSLLDTSAIIDGRIADVCRTGTIEGALLVPKFVLQELHDLADSADNVRRRRGRRGLEMLHGLQRTEGLEVQLHDARNAAGASVDAKLVSLAASLQARIITCDYNLGKIAELQSVRVVNLNDLANALRPIALPGEDVQVKLIRPGDEPGQGVGFLPDGTMVVVDQGRDRLGATVTIVVTSVLQTSAGRMIFGKFKETERDR